MGLISGTFDEFYWLNVDELDPNKIEVIKNVDLDAIFVTPKIKSIKPMPGGFIGVDLTKQTLDRDWTMPHGSHVLTDKEIEYLIAYSMIGNHKWDDELKNEFERIDNNDGK